MAKTEDNNSLEQEYKFQPIAVYRGQFKQKFGIPRQAGILEDIEGEIHFAEKYRDRSAFKGIEGYTHLWLLWVFSENKQAEKFRPTVRPPRLKGDQRVGVFASRSPRRPNPIGMSCVELIDYYWDDKLGPVLKIKGSDLMDGTPILDIKPYIPYADSKPEAIGGFAKSSPDKDKLKVIWEPEVESLIDEDSKNLISNVLALDPRPAYQEDADRIYGMAFSKWNVKFKVENKVLKVIAIEPLKLN